MASPLYDGNAYPSYTFTDAGGQTISLWQSGPADGPGAHVLEFRAGGQQGESRLRLSQQNAIDIVAAIVGFANTGVLS